MLSDILIVLEIPMVVTKTPCISLGTWFGVLSSDEDCVTKLQDVSQSIQPHSHQSVKTITLNNLNI